jgi:uncharacterized damage-inducible protein DinB
MPLAKQALVTQVDYSGWANRRLLEACTSLTAEELNRELGVSHGSIIGTLHHIYRGERFWTECLRTHSLPPLAAIGEPPRSSPPPPEPELGVLQQQWISVWPALRTWLDDLPDPELDRELTSHRPNGQEFRIPAWKLLLHVMNHSTLHRGQIVFMLRSMGKASPGADLFDYYRSD